MIFGNSRTEKYGLYKENKERGFCGDGEILKSSGIYKSTHHTYQVFEPILQICLIVLHFPCKSNLEFYSFFINEKWDFLA